MKTVILSSFGEETDLIIHLFVKFLFLAVKRTDIPT